MSHFGSTGIVRSKFVRMEAQRTQTSIYHCQTMLLSVRYVHVPVSCCLPFRGCAVQSAFCSYSRSISPQSYSDVSA